MNADPKAMDLDTIRQRIDEEMRKLVVSAEQNLFGTQAKVRASTSHRPIISISESS